MTGKDKFHKVMSEFKEGTLESHGQKVTDRNQAIAIAYSEAQSVEPGFGENPISIDKIEEIIGTFELTEGITINEIVNITGVDKFIVDKVLTLYEEDLSAEEIWDKIHNEKPMEKKTSKLSNAISPKEMVDENKFYIAIDDEVFTLKDFLDGNTTRIDKDVIPLPDKDIENIKNLKVGEEYIADTGSKITRVKSAKSKLKEFAGKSKEKLVELEDKAKEKIKEVKEKANGSEVNPYYSKDEYVKINDLSQFASAEFLTQGKMMKLNKAVRGFRDKKGDKVIIYYNTKDLQKFLDDNGIYYTLFESKDELNKWLEQFKK